MKLYRARRQASAVRISAFLSSKMNDIEKEPLLSSSEEDTPMENREKKRVSKMMTCPIKRPLFSARLDIIGAASVICAVMLFLLVFLAVKCVQMGHEIDSLKRYNTFLGRRISSIEDPLRRFIDNRTDSTLNEIRLIETGSRFTPNTEHNSRESFEEMKRHLNAITSVVGKLSASIRKMNASSVDSKLSRLFGILNKAKHDIICLHDKLVQLNTSGKLSLVSAVKILKQDLKTLRNSTVQSIQEYWEQWIRTNADIEGILKLLAKQNVTLRLQIADRKAKFHEETVNAFQKFRGALNRTRDNSAQLQQNVNDEIARVSKNSQKALKSVEDSIASLRSSLADINGKVDRMEERHQNTVHNLIREQKQIKDDFAEAKAEFQKKHEKIDSAISGQVEKITNLKENIQNVDSKTSRISKLERNLHKLQGIVYEMKNEAIRALGINDISINLFSLAITARLALCL